MRPTHPGTIRHGALVVCLLLALAACGDRTDEEAAIVDDTPEPTVTVTETVTPEPDPDPDVDEPEETDEDDTPVASPDPCDDPPTGVDFIFVTDPSAGDEVGSTFTVEGCSSTFEANVIWRLSDADGNVLADGYTMGGTMGEAGELSFEVSYSADGSQTGELRVFAEDARDGSEMFVNSIPLVLNP
jgi:hypothetical protein